MKRKTDHYASYKDPSARVFYLEDEPEHIFRKLSTSYLHHYDYFISSGLKDELTSKNWLIPFEETRDGILKAKKIRFVSYPYEWSFNQWKDAALLTLKIQYQALKFGMTLKDATPFNIVFDGCRPVFIDLSSFEIFEGKPWQGFKQFSENFHLPLLLIKYFDSVGNDVYMNNLNGIPLSKGLPLLPVKAYFNFNSLFYLALPNKIRNQSKPGKELESAHQGFSQKKSMQFAEQLFRNIEKIKKTKKKTKWNSYYRSGSDPEYVTEKENVVKEWIASGNPGRSLIDFGCNTGHFSTLLSPYCREIIAFDEDIAAVDELYTHCRENKLSNIFSFCANLAQPTPALGFNNKERSPLLSRLEGDVGIALALIHHLAITNYLNFEMMSGLFAGLCRELIIEFVPKTDDKIQLLLSNREDIFEWYNYENFINSFENQFMLIKTHRFTNSRVLVHFIIKDEK